MPVIPRLPPPGPLAPGPDPVLDRTPLPRVDLRGVIDATGELGQAARMPMQDPNAVAAPYHALGAVGEAVASAGSIIAATALKRQESMDTRALNGAYEAMSKATEQYTAFQGAHADEPHLWGAEMQRLAQGAIGPYLEMKTLSGAARKDLLLMAESWQRRLATRVDTEATKAEFRLAKQSYQTRMRRHYDQGEMEQAAQTGQAAVRAGFFSQEDFEAMQTQGQMHYEQRQRQQRYEALAAEAWRAPLEAPALLAEAEAAQGLAPAQRYQLDQTRQRALHHHRARENEQVHALVHSGAVRSAADLRAFPHLQARDQAAWARQISQPRFNDPAELFRTRAAIARYRPEDDATGEQVAELQARIAQQAQGEPAEALATQLVARQQPGAVTSPLEAATLWLDEAVFERNGLGPWRTERVADDGSPLAVEDEEIKSALGRTVRGMLAQVQRALQGSEKPNANEARKLAIEQFVDAGGTLPLEGHKSRYSFEASPELQETIRLMDQIKEYQAKPIAEHEFNSFANKLKHTPGYQPTVHDRLLEEMKKETTSSTWGMLDAARMYVERLRDGKSRTLFDYKDDYVKQHAITIRVLSEVFNLPPALLAGVAWSEVGGSVDYLTDTAAFYASSSGLSRKRSERRTLGEVQISTELAADQMGMPIQRQNGNWRSLFVGFPESAIPASQIDVINRLERTSAWNLYAVASHLSEIRNQRFPSANANSMTSEQVSEIGYAYNAGLHKSIGEAKESGSNYGDDILAKYERMRTLLRK